MNDMCNMIDFPGGEEQNNGNEKNDRAANVSDQFSEATNIEPDFEVQSPLDTRCCPDKLQ